MSPTQDESQVVSRYIEWRLSENWEASAPIKEGKSTDALRQMQEWIGYQYLINEVLLAYIRVLVGNTNCDMSAFGDIESPHGS